MPVEVAVVGDVAIVDFLAPLSSFVTDYQYGNQFLWANAASATGPKKVSPSDAAQAPVPGWLGLLTPVPDAPLPAPMLSLPGSLGRGPPLRADPAWADFGEGDVTGIPSATDAAGPSLGGRAGLIRIIHVYRARCPSTGTLAIPDPGLAGLATRV